MALLSRPFNVEGNDSQMEDFSAIPAGDYVVEAVKSDYKATKAGNGYYAEFMFKVVEGEFEGKAIWERMNLDNPNPTAVEIATKKFNTLCSCCGKAGVENTEELHNIPVIAVVRLEPASANYGESNSISTFKQYGEAGDADTPWSDD